MTWDRTKCSECPQSGTCPEKTKLYINYCGSQRMRNEPRIVAAWADCLARRGLNYLNIRINHNVAVQRKGKLQPV